MTVTVLIQRTMTDRSVHMLTTDMTMMALAHSMEMNTKTKSAQVSAGVTEVLGSGGRLRQGEPTQPFCPLDSA